MTDQLPPHQRHSETSREAAESIEPCFARLVNTVLAFLRQQGIRGATDVEISAGTGIRPNSERPARVTLMHNGLVKDSGMRRRTETGRRAVVWVLAEHAHWPVTATTGRASPGAALRKENAALRAKAEQMKALLLDMRQHQGSIQSYIKRIDALLLGGEAPCEKM